MTPYYQDDAVTIYHGDCRELLPTLNWDVAVTDPPYGVGFEYASYADTPEAFREVVLPVLVGMAEAGPTAVCMSMRNVHLLPVPRWQLCWFKPGSTRRNALGGFSIWEPISVYGPGWKVANDAIRLPDCTNHSEANGHPCPKPLALFRWLVAMHSGPVVIDPFMGSGTTLRATKDLGRKAIGIEIEEKYCEIAARRMCQEVLAI